MGEDFLNLYRITIRIEGKVFTRFVSKAPLKKELINKIRYRLFKKYNLPVIYRDGSFLVLGTIKDANVEIELGENEVIFLENKGFVKLKSFIDDQEVQNFLKDMVSVFAIHEKFARDHIEKFKTQFNGKFIDIYLIPYIIDRIFKRWNTYVLQLDIRFRLLPGKNLQELLESGIISSQDLYSFRIKPLGHDFTSRILEIKKAMDLGKNFIKSYFYKAVGKITKKYWNEILNKPEVYKKAFIVFLENNYVYPASMLYPVIDFESLDEKLVAKLSRKVKLSPKERITLIRNVLKKYQGILTPWGINVSNKEERVDGRIYFNNTLVDAEGRTTKIETNMKHFLKHLKPFVKNPDVDTYVLMIDRTYDKQLSYNRKQFLTELIEFLKQKGINLNIGKIEKITAQKRIDALKKLSSLIKDMKEYNLVLTFLEEYGKKDPYTEEVLIYDYLKKELLRYMVPSQIVLNTTLKIKPPNGWEFILLNVAEQIMAKTGNIPYKIRGEIGGADFFIGIDISRITRGKTLNVGAFTKIFAKDGTFLRYKLLSESTFGESISRKAIQELFLALSEMNVKEGAKIVIHRDGVFLKDEVLNFINLAKEFNYNVELVEIIKRGNPRIFPKGNNRIKGDFYKFNENTLVLATYNNIYKGTHQPLRIRKVFGELHLERLASQVLSLTLMNYSSFQPIKLPATTHYSDKITKLLLRNIEPAQKEGNIMYWL